MTASSWPWSYRVGMKGSLTGDEDARRKWYGIEAIKGELVDQGYGPDINLGTGQFGGRTRDAVMVLQQVEKPNGIGAADGIVGRKTANALFRPVFRDAEKAEAIPRQLLRAHCHWESGDDPGAELVNSDFSRDRGLTQANDKHDGTILSDQQAFNPATAVPIRAHSIAHYYLSFAGHTVLIADPEGFTHEYDGWDIAVAAHRTPVGAKALAAEPKGAIVTAKRRQDGGTWEEAAAYYCWRLEFGGAMDGWVG